MNCEVPIINPIHMPIDDELKMLCEDVHDELTLSIICIKPDVAREDKMPDLDGSVGYIIELGLSHVMSKKAEASVNHDYANHLGITRTNSSIIKQNEDYRCNVSFRAPNVY